ncbi:MAG: fatty acid desaturase [Chloroflexi bacterium RBG_16_57_11]|nr:MAG: fatty acid desaturase [Chloroflexi bacterium RBG_16_57_11]
MAVDGLSPEDETGKLTWQQVIARYQHPSISRSLWQVINTLLPYFALWFLMVLSLRVSYWLTLLLAIPAAGFMIRTFILFHDCGHGSFFESKRANTALGIFTGLLTFTPYYTWTHAHAVHHATVADLDRRGVGDVWTLTVKEYQDLPGWKKLVYRFTRNPLIMFTIGSLSVFLIGHRFAKRGASRRERSSVAWTNLALLAIISLLSLIIGLKAFILIQLPIMFLGTSVGVWLFYVQHQFEGTYWARHNQWDYLTAALKGSSFYKLPGVLQWFTGNIGFHHIHHVSPRIPNYLLENCHNAHPLFRQVKPLTLLSSLRSLRLRLWDEEAQKLVGYAELKKIIW